MNTDVSFGKNFGLTGGKTAQVKIEIFNLFNRVATSGIVVAAGNSTFGQITAQSGFMRMTQVMFRFTF